MPGINQATVGDGYTAAATVQDVFTSTGGWFSVSTQPVVLQLQWGPNASGSRWSDEQTLGAGAFGTIPPGCTGIRFRNLVAGSAATVTAYIGAGGPAPDPRGNVWPEPALAISALGSVTTSGTAPTRQVLSAAGAGTYNTPAGCVAILVECIGGGGAGGGAAATAAGQTAAGGGGAGGEYRASIIPAPASSYAYIVGAGGTPGAAGAPGGAGVDTNFAAGTVLGKGGGGGTASGAAAAPVFVGVGSSGGAGGTGQLGVNGQPGGGGIGLTSAAGGTLSGYGGAGGRGGGGAPGVYSSGGGAAATGVGGGGSGAASAAGSGARQGGAGAAGVIIVTEFY